MTVNAPASATIQRFPGLDGVRAVAVLIVFFGHAPGTNVLPGPAGVTLFFFLSGFLITTLLRLEATHTGLVSLRSFYLRRLLRIVPPLLVAVVLAILADAVGIVTDRWNATGLLSSLFFFNNYYIAFAHDPGGTLNTLPLWSLAVEEHFYLLFPLLYVGLRRRLPSPRQQGVVLLGLCLIVLAWRFVLAFGLHVHGLYLFLATDSRVDEILAGCALALMANPVLGEWPGRIRVDRLWPIAVVLFCASAKYGSFTLAGVGRPTFQLGLMAVLFAAVLTGSQSGPLKILNAAPVRWLGRVSYSFYLVHDLVLRTLKEHAHSSPLIVLSGLVITLALAGVMHELIEKPSNRLRHRLDRVPLAAGEAPTRREPLSG